MGLFGKKQKSLDEQIKEQQNQLIHTQKLINQQKTLADKKRQLARLKTQNQNIRLDPIMQKVKPIEKMFGKMWKSITPLDPITLEPIKQKQIKKKIKK